MTTNVDSITAKKMIDNKIIRISMEAVEYHILRLEEGFDQLESIYRLNVSTDIKKEACNYLKKQNKLIEITNDLKIRFQSLKPLRILNAVRKEQDYDLDQLLLELDILNAMHFKLKKTYFSFVHKYYVNTRPTRLEVA